jgi:peptidoglycan/xylan/chitin deacetylase (PgdA/CDA1 family)
MEKMIIIICVSIALFMSCKSNDSANAGNKYPAPDKLCALTFDDGPNTELTPLVLDKLKAHGVAATFFVIGQLIDEDTAPVLKREIEMGCEIGNHSWALDSMDEMTAEEILKSVGDTTAKIKEFTGTTPHFFRPPNLAASDTMYETINMPFVSGVLGYDWAGCDTTAGERAQNVLDGMRDGAVILLHDVQPPPHPTPEALDILIPELKKRGYEFVTLSELFARKGVALTANHDTMWTYVE